MFGGLRFHGLVAEGTESVLSSLLLMLTAAGKVTVLLFMMGGLVRAEDANKTDLRVFEFTSEFHLPMGRSRLDGIMACDGSQHRIVIYWIEPALFRESPSFLRYSDFIFGPEVVRYWIYGGPQPGIFQFSESPSDPLLPRQNSVESVVRSALAILSRIRCHRQSEGIPLEVGKFFQQSRGEAELTYEVLSDEADSNDLAGRTASDVGILNALPYGRKYSKESRSDGALVWRARRALNGQPLVTVTVKPLAGIQKNQSPGVFDAQSLGQWTLVPEPYRAYWSFDRAYSELSASPDVRISSLELYDKVESYLDNSKAPAYVCRALDRLRFKTALMTDDTRCVSRSAQAAVTGLCQDDSVGRYEGLLELARIGGEIEKRYPQQAEELLRPLVGQMVKHAGRDAVGSLDKLMPAIDANKWFTYGRLLLEKVRSQGLAEEDMVETLAARLEASRLARRRDPPDPCESTPTVKQYLAQFDANPPRGTIDMNDVRHILHEGLATHYTDANAEAKRKVVEDVIRSIRLIVGEGPFPGDQAQLIKSIERFSGLYLVVDKTPEPIDTVLATFLALSFCDISTPEDHDALSLQFHKLCAGLQSQVNTMLSERGLGSLVTPEDVEGVFRLYERIFRRYIDDPLWPAFKFPLTANEEARLANKLKLRFVELKALFDEMSLKVKYGGTSAELKKKTIYEISRAAQQLLPETAFLRSPPYPGVSCQYRAGYGFTAGISSPLYEDGNRAKEKFNAMKYFHLGHRLEEAVKHERESLAR